MALLGCAFQQYNNQTRAALVGAGMTRGWFCPIPLNKPFRVNDFLKVNYLKELFSFHFHCYVPPPELGHEAVTFPGCYPEFAGITFLT